MNLLLLHFSRMITFLLVIFCLYFAFIFALIRGGEQIKPTISDNLLFSVAESVSLWSIPDLHSAIARYDYERAILAANDRVRSEWLLNSRMHWIEASRLRPGWPYYQIGAFSAEVSLGFLDQENVQMRFNQVIAIAPNERGIDRDIFRLGFRLWGLLQENQKKRLIKRVSTSGREVPFALMEAEKYKLKGLVCIRLPWALAKRYCVGGEIKK